MELVFLLLEEVLEIHDQQIERYGESTGIRDTAGPETAAAAPQATFDGQFLHRSVPAMAAACLFHLCQNHPFVGGNKRMGANAAITFLLLNDWQPDFDEDELVDLVVSLASGGLSKARLVEIFEARCNPPEENRSRQAPLGFASSVQLQANTIPLDGLGKVCHAFPRRSWERTPLPTCCKARSTC